jgi:hypothetical protein
MPPIKSESGAKKLRPQLTVMLIHVSLMTLHAISCTVKYLQVISREALAFSTIYGLGCQTFVNRPNVVGEPSFHRGRHAERLMDARIVAPTSGRRRQCTERASLIASRSDPTIAVLRIWGVGRRSR